MLVVMMMIIIIIIIVQVFRNIYNFYCGFVNPAQPQAARPPPVGCGVEWIQLAQDRGMWWALVNTVMKLLVLAPQLTTTIIINQ
jgi:hypothetical protein